MIGLKAWWRRFGGLTAALVLAVLAVGPTADLLICSGEGVPTAEASASPMTVLASTADDQHPAAPWHSDRGGVCPHGHCHHGGISAPVAAALVSDPVSHAERLPVPQSVSRISYLNFGLERPPRV